MMRRIVDGALPVCAAIAGWPATLGVLPLPPSMLLFVGPAIARAWMATMAISFTAITVGVVVSKHRPDLAFKLEAIPFSFVGMIFGLHVVALFAVNGLTAWATGWWEMGIIAYFYARCAELWITLRRIRQLSQERR